jgi:hypothetical protein
MRVQPVRSRLDSRACGGCGPACDGGTGLHRLAGDHGDAGGVDAEHEQVARVACRDRPVLVDVAPGGSDADLEADREARIGVAVAQMGQGEQGLPAGLQAPPPRSALLAVAAMRSARSFRMRLDNGIVAG